MMTPSVGSSWQSSSAWWKSDGQNLIGPMTIAKRGQTSRTIWAILGCTHLQSLDNVTSHESIYRNQYICTNWQWIGAAARRQTVPETVLRHAVNHWRAPLVHKRLQAATSFSSVLFLSFVVAVHKGLSPELAACYSTSLHGNHGLHLLSERKVGHGTFS